MLNEIKSGAVGLAGLLLTSATENFQMWFGIICSAIITLSTVFVQVYRSIRDRDDDLKKSKKQEDKDQNEKIGE